MGQGYCDVQRGCSSYRNITYAVPGVLPESRLVKLLKSLTSVGKCSEPLAKSRTYFKLPAMRVISLLIGCCLVLTLSLNRDLVRAQNEAFGLGSLKERGALSSVQETIIRKRRELIVNEASTLANEWVGTYSLEDSLTSGAQLNWAPTNGFLVWWNSCSHGWSDRINWGRVDFQDRVLRLATNWPAVGQKLYNLAPELVTVKWDQQHYLIPSKELVAFCYAARNADRSYEINEFFLKEGDRENRRSGLPAVPEDYKKYLVGKPIQARIVGLKSEPARGVKRFRLNVGRRVAVFRGMKFFAISTANIYMLVEVTEVGESDCEAYVITSGFKNHSTGEVRPQVGWRLSSRAPKRAYEYYPG
jgi:hypothetical protein